MTKINRSELRSQRKMLQTDAYKLFIESRKSFCSPATVGIYEFQMKQIITDETEYIEDVTPDMLRNVLTEFRKTHNDGGTWRVYSSMRAFYNWYWSEYDIDFRNPISKVTCKKPSVAPIKGITHDEIQKILQAIKRISKFPERDKAFVLLLADTGLRRSSIVNLRFKDVNIEESTLFVYEKDQKYHTKPFGKESQKALRKYLSCLSDYRQEDYFWINQSGERMKEQGFRMMLHRMEDEANIPHYQYHAFRRFYGLELYKSTHDIYFVSRALDHKDVEVTKRYLALNDFEDAEAIRAMSPMDNKNNITINRKKK